MQEHLLTMRVYYADTDAIGIVYHANYLRYFEAGRTEALRSKGIALSSLLNEYGVQFAVVSANVLFHKPARLEDQILIATKINKIGRASIAYQQSIYLSDKQGELLCNAEIKLATVDKHMRVHKLPDMLLHIIQNDPNKENL